MKKFLFLGLAAMMAFTSCTKDETLATAELGAIGFENAFIDNATRAITPVDPSYNNSALMPNFNVYGFFDANFQNLLFDATEVTVANGACSYNPIQYWAPGHTYYFQAIAPVSENWTLAKAETLEAAQAGPGVVTFTNIDGTEDLLYAEAEKTTEATISAQPEKVGLTFKHLLSKIRFEFVNKFASESYSFKVDNVTITNAVKTAAYDLVADNKAWTNHGTETSTLAFGNVATIAQGVNDYAAEERMLIPGTQDLNVTFDVVLYANGVEMGTYQHSVDVEKFTLTMGYSYNFKAEIDASNVTGDENVDLYPIEFTVDSIEDWVPFENNPVDMVESYEQKLRMELGVATDNGIITLQEDVLLTTGALIIEGKNVTIDLNGKSITTLSTVYNPGVASALIVAGNGATVTIKGNGVVNSLFEGYDVATDYDIPVETRGGKLIIEGGVYTGISHAAYAAANGEITIKGGEFSVAEAGAYVINCQDNKGTITVEGGSFVDFNPANNGAEGANTNFVADGFGVVAEGNVYTVVPVAAGNTLTADAVVDGTFEVSGAFDGKNFTIFADAVLENNYLVKLAQGASIANVTVDGKNAVTADGKGVRNIMITKGGNYTITNVISKNNTYAFNTSTQENGTVNIKDCTFEGWTSYDKNFNVTMENVKFEIGASQKTFRPQGVSYLKNCSFEEGFIILLDLVANGSITFENCTYGGRALQASDLTDSPVANVTIQ